jgi:hypothetical protein
MEQIWTVAALWVGMALLASLIKPVTHVFMHHQASQNGIMQ